MKAFVLVQLALTYSPRMLQSRVMYRFITVDFGKQIKIKTLCSREFWRSRTRFRKGLLQVQFVNELGISASFTPSTLVDKYGEF